MNIFPLIIGTGFALFGIYMLRYAVRNFQKSIASQEWPTTPGRIVDIHLWGTRNIGGEMIAGEYLNVKYEYEVQQNSYIGTSPSFYTLVYPETTNFAKNNPEGSIVTVYYNSEKPVESVLVPGPKADKPYSELILATIAIFVGATVAVMAWLGALG